MKECEAPIDHHFSGHSHRAAVIQAHVTGNSAQAIQCKNSGQPEALQAMVLSAVDPGVHGPQNVAAGKTAFIVSSCGGPIGVQNLEGELSGWTLRPPSGTRLEGKTLTQFKTLRQAPEQGLSEKPRLAVALDYLHVMGADKDNHIDQPLLMFDAAESPPGPYRDISLTGGFAVREDEKLPSFVVVRESKQMIELDCLQTITVWVFEKGQASQSDDADENRGQWKKLQGVSWNKGTRKVGKHGHTYSKLELDKSAREQLEKLMVKRQDDRGRELAGRAVLQAMCEVELQDPQRAWSADMDCEDPWVFPLEIGMWPDLSQINTGPFRREDAVMQMHNEFRFRRPLGEKGEVPDWEFLARYFAHKGYPLPKDAIRPDPKDDKPARVARSYGQL